MRKDWIKIKNQYIHHNLSLEQLAKKYKVSLSALKQHCRDEKWVQLKEEKQAEIEQAVTQKTTQAVIDKKVAANERHNDLLNQGLDVVEMLLTRYKNELNSGKKKTQASAYNIHFIMKAIADAQKGQRLSLNIDKESSGSEAEPQVSIIEGVNIDKI